MKDERFPGLEHILNYVNENYVSKDEPAINEHHYHITKNNTTKKRITHTMQIKPTHIILATTYIQMSMRTIKYNM